MIIANWKANGSFSSNIAWCSKFSQLFSDNNHEDIGIAPSNIHFNQIQKFFENSKLAVGLQDIDYIGGARTGSISASIASEAGCIFSLLGHSERRVLFNEGNDLINTKIKAALSNNIQPVVCIGESEECFKDGKTNDFLKNQIITALSDVIDENQIVIAYEPIWAIGTGKTPTPKDINSIHEFIKDVVQSTTANSYLPKVLYGGSVNSENAEAFFNCKNIDGALVGGASLDGKHFAKIVNEFNRIR